MAYTLIKYAPFFIEMFHNSLNYHYKKYYDNFSNKPNGMTNFEYIN